MIVENPNTQPHYLTYYFPVKPKVIDKNRRENGDYFNKPTQYWFVNCDPEQNVVFEPLEPVEQIIVEYNHDQVVRSGMHPQYARRFILTYILDKEQSKANASWVL